MSLNEKDTSEDQRMGRLLRNYLTIKRRSADCFI